ncbi:SCO family protein [soil metagenome]
MRRSAAAMLGVVMATSLCACGEEPGADLPVSNVVIEDGDGMRGVVLPEPYAVPAVQLRATDGTSYSLASDARDPLTLVFFGYTQCPDICQVVMADIASALTRLEDDERAQVGMQFVTTDPARDDEQTLREYLDRFDPRFGGLTGPLPKIIDAGQSLGIPVEKGRRLPSGGYEVNHGAQIVGVLPDATAPIVWTHGTSPEHLAEDIGKIVDSGVPDVRGQPAGIQ